MVVSLRADDEALRAFARKQRDVAAVWSVLGVALSVAILVYDYRLMLFAFIAMTPCVVSAIAAWQARKHAYASGFVELVCEPQGMIVRTQHGETLALWTVGPTITRRPDALAVAWRADGHWHRWTVPGNAESLSTMVTAMVSHGIVVRSEPGPAALVGVMLGALGMPALRVIAGALVIGCLANVGLVLLGRGGSIVKGLACLAGAFGCLLVQALLLRVLRTVTATRLR